MMKNLLIIFFILFFTACSNKNLSVENRIQNANNFAKQNNLEVKIISSSYFNHYIIEDKNLSCKEANIYIEGDGLAWLNKTTVSANPTPINQNFLELLKYDNSCKIYIARPCQYINSNSCNLEYWTNKRFSKEVIDSFDEVLNILKNEKSIEKFNLIGFSGGGAVAALLASKRDDIKNLVTIAGNLDIDKWTKLHNISPLEGSLNPSEITSSLELTKQFHLIGKIDDVVPKEVFFSYYNKFHNKNNISYKIVNASHNCCFNEDFKIILDKIK